MGLHIFNSRKLVQFVANKNPFNLLIRGKKTHANPLKSVGITFFVKVFLSYILQKYLFCKLLILKRYLWNYVISNTFWR
ncbi:hypothetical protein D0809_25580 [Flavobacterium circumlabens]|uniref:Uncharacterized protein n=1 Tax=Flavobacterium circumlabens TaxID=2133765 RepID=A0A4Y7U4S2_9FLAO|nr:hypothetical protein D0809_25580 [Flavobacterium circumlabens]